MAIYQPNGGSGIGTLLRMIKEQRSQGPIVPPSAQVSSPIREVVQGPLETPESPETSRVISVRPETSPTSTSVAPVGPIAPSVRSSASTPVAPVNPVVAPVNTAVPKQVEGPMQAKVAGAVAPREVSPMSIGTKITPPPNALVGEAPTSIVGRSRSGVAVLEPAPNPTPTPAPSRGSSVAGQTKVYAQTGSTVPYPTQGPTPPPSYNPLRNENTGPSIGTKILSSAKKLADILQMRSFF